MDQTDGTRCDVTTILIFTQERNMRKFDLKLALAASLVVIANLAFNGAAFAESESGGVFFGGGESESGGVYGGDSSSESGGLAETGAESESGGLSETGAETESGGLAETGAETESGGLQETGAESESGGPELEIRNY